ncbi:hypothetical protein K458DRAFT_200716 [Lentithecium fluviatile CBS 122367]|uniref:Uncharacterized protein n=1 Tax=Lentithecium fluviatile CBS 122367 TaxID=1168545 RepID=A0A6G1J8U4_9PLEO|nr:hypothetical protein K458DRAFT_200716 [Lentithecium fluviatile CBS 122367]
MQLPAFVRSTAQTHEILLIYVTWLPWLAAQRGRWRKKQRPKAIKSREGNRETAAMA